MTTQPEPDPSDDYGYDCAHEVKAALQNPLRTERREVSTPRDTGRPDADGDYGYDEVHDF